MTGGFLSLLDDLAVGARQVSGFDASRELPIVWAVAKGSLLNKAVLVPGVLLLDGAFPKAVTPLKEGLIRYQVSKTNGGPSYHEWPGAEFVGRAAAIVPPPRKHVVRYYEALGPRSPLRSAMTAATRGRGTLGELEWGYSVTPAGKVAREARRAAKAAGRAAALQLSVEAALPRAIARSRPLERGGGSLHWRGSGVTLVGCGCSPVKVG